MTLSAGDEGRSVGGVEGSDEVEGFMFNTLRWVSLSATP